MKKLLIMRHAKSTWKDTDVSDHERPLKKRGKADAKMMGKHLRSKKLIPDLIICSTAIRAKETADFVIEGMKYKGDVIYSDALYMAEPSNIISTIIENGKKNKTLMVIGHNPGSEALLQILTGKVESLPTASVAYINAKIDSWKEIEKTKDIKLKKLWRPKDLE